MQKLKILSFLEKLQIVYASAKPHSYDLNIDIKKPLNAV
jgi:hypothetical protein